MIWVKLAVIALSIFLLILIIRCIAGRLYLKRVMKDSLIVFGKKGKGKTLLFSKMAAMCRKGYVSTTDFKHRKQEILKYGEVNVGENTWEDVLDGNIKPIEAKPWEGKPIFLDDAGVYLPNFADGTLKKEYASMPIAYAVWRHLYNAPIHINAQSVERAWKMIREQADGFIQVRGTRWLFGLGFIKCTYYDRIESAKLGLSPMKKSLFNKYSTAEVELYRAQHGEIKDFLIFAPAIAHRYNDRYFKDVFFKKPPKEQTVL